jgi:endonuclease-3
MLGEPVAAASRVKRVLQSVFEANYAFDIESLKKQNIGVAQKRLAKYGGVTPFGVAYATQTGLGGHSIPLGRGALEVLYIIGAISDKERASGEVAGLERAIPKNKGIEFGALLNQLGVDYAKNPMSPVVRKLLLSIAPDAKDRFPKRTRPEPEPVPPAVSAAAAPVAAPQPKRKGEPAAPAPPGAKSAAAANQPAPAPGKRDASTKAAPPAKSAKPPVAKTRPAAKSQPVRPPVKKPPTKIDKPARSKAAAGSGRGGPRKPR